MGIAEASLRYQQHYVLIENEQFVKLYKYGDMREVYVPTFSLFAYAMAN